MADAAGSGGWEEVPEPGPEPTELPPGWVPASPPPVAPEPRREADPDLPPVYHGKKRFWITTVIFLLIFAVGASTIDTGGQPFWLLVPLVPLYLITLPFVLRKPKGARRIVPGSEEKLGKEYKVMITVAVFLALYIPFTFFSNDIIPYAAIFEYVLFALLLFLLFRLAGRALGVTSSLDALPPPTHRLHRQVVGQIDDLHYQQNLYLNYNFVERGRGAHHLARRLDSILEENGVAAARRQELLGPLNAQGEERGFFLGRRSRQRVAAGRDARARVLDELFSRLNRELENTA